MIPEEIVKILQKYQNENSELLCDINNNILKIIEKLYSVNFSLAEQIKNLLLDKDTNNNAEEIMKDSITLRDYIKSIQYIDVGNESKNIQTNEISDELLPDI